MNIPKPQDPMVRKLDLLVKTVQPPQDRKPKPLKTQQRVMLPSSDSEAPHMGTVTTVDADGFSVTWDGHGRKRGTPRTRHHYPWASAHNFGGRSGN
jgi:hypothetical protein